MASNNNGRSLFFGIQTAFIRYAPSGDDATPAVVTASLVWEPNTGEVDFYYGGPGYISGTVKVGGVIAPGKKVRLLDHASGYIVASTASASDGTYSFRNLRTDVAFDVMGIDPTNAYNIVVASNLFAIP